MEANTLRVLFLNPPDLGGQVWMKEVGRCGRRAIANELWPQTGLAYLAAMVEGEDHRARIIDAMAEPMTLEELEKECHDWRPDVVIANSATPTIRNDVAVLDRLSRAGSVMWGLVGPHASALPEETLRESAASFVLVNEAEETVADLVWRLADLMRVAESEGPHTPYVVERVTAALSGIKGMVWRLPDQFAPTAGERIPGERGSRPAPFSSEIVVNPPRPLIANLNELPLPARHLLPNHVYRMPFFADHPFATVIPCRGCPWPCAFCRAGKVWGRRVRLRSVENVLEELEILQRGFGVRHIVFMTDSLTLDRDWARRLFVGMRDLRRPVEWICNSRVDAVDAETLGLMKNAGCRLISYGVESASPEILSRSRKGISIEQSERAILLTRQAGILSMAYFVLGLPGETAESVEESIRFAQRLDPDYVNFHVATPFPGTDLYEEALEKGWLTTRNWEDYEEEGSAVLRAGELNPEDLVRAQARAMRAFYMRPRRLAKELARLRGWSDFRAKMRAGLRTRSALRRGKSPPSASERR
jgi:radical SAM superfamily enzyme YgiQ (UPF0313 family)